MLLISVFSRLKFDFLDFVNVMSDSTSKKQQQEASIFDLIALIQQIQQLDLNQLTIQNAKNYATNNPRHACK